VGFSRSCLLVSMSDQWRPSVDQLCEAKTDGFASLELLQSATQSTALAAVFADRVLPHAE
jgi:hypothetical protein